MTKKVAVAEAKAHLSELLRVVEERGERIVVERRGRPVAVIGPYDESLDESELNWVDRLDGVAAEIADFDSIMKEVIKSRRDAKPRPVRLED